MGPSPPLLRLLLLRRLLRASHRRISSLNSSIVRSMSAEPIDPETEMASWFVSGMPRTEVRQMAMDMLKKGRPGNFLIRDVKSEPNCYGMSVRTTQNKLVNYLIEKRAQPPGFCIRGTKRTFPTVAKLVEFYAQEKRQALGLKLVPTDHSQFMHASSSDDSDDSDHGDARHPHKPPGPGDFAPDSDSDDGDGGILGQSQEPSAIGTRKGMSDSERWAANARREEEEYQRTLGRSTKRRTSRQALSTHGHGDDHTSHRSVRAARRSVDDGEDKRDARDHPRDRDRDRHRHQPKSLRSVRSTRSAISTARSVHSLHSAPNHPALATHYGYDPHYGALPMSMHPHHPVLQQSQPQLAHPGLMGGAHGAYPGVAPYGGPRPSLGYSGLPPNAQPTGTQLRAAEAQLALMRAEAEMYQAQLRAAETTLRLHQRRAEDSAEQDRYTAQANAIATGDFSHRGSTHSTTGSASNGGSAVVTASARAHTPVEASNVTPTPPATLPSPHRSGSAPTSISRNRTPDSMDQDAEFDIEQQTRLIEAEAAALTLAVEDMRRSQEHLDRDEPASAVSPTSDDQPDDPDSFNKSVRFADNPVLMARSPRPLRRQRTRETPAEQTGSDSTTVTVDTSVAPGSGTSQAPSAPKSILMNTTSPTPVDENDPNPAGGGRSVQEQLAVYLRRLDQRESERRVEFEVHITEMQQQARSKPYNQRIQAEMEIDRLEMQEMERRREWERHREEREARYLANPKLAEANLLRESGGALPNTDADMDADDLASGARMMGIVQRLRTKFQAPAEDQKRKAHVMTWKVKETDVRKAVVP
ncbi:uncharacterized protein MONBRDRAFT_26443 [Monosiga brevicollis MX1]|uniref:SH2 domain-containing protein n=1 Tax=Monosiga brevicollis TaxID=81824 RepID=A9V2D7_MONBE|nr:uncharacterized protein MONBRDRAFT_26443 [Monosiga brevicollis MX1]EDQ88358.1 predicted protein [Monosiga brevicollis MX1]|eukprot:XP_001746951.1 hypothetical protein [Monosiga brevicollis MX1]